MIERGVKGDGAWGEDVKHPSYFRETKSSILIHSLKHNYAINDGQITYETCNISYLPCITVPHT